MGLLMIASEDPLQLGNMEMNVLNSCEAVVQKRKNEV